MKTADSNEPRGKGRGPFPFHPAAYAAFPAIALYAKNIHDAQPLHLYRSLGASLLLVGLVWACFALIFKSVARGAAFASAFAILFFSYRDLKTAVLKFTPSLGLPSATVEPLYLYLWAGAALCLVFLASAKRLDPARVTTAFNVFSITVLGLTLFQLFTVVKADAVVRQATPPMLPLESLKPAPPGPKPDIFYIVLDTYGRADVLQSYMGIDNSAFIDDLAKRGFAIADQATGNYPYTDLALTSTLNLEYIQTLFPGGDQNRGRLLKMLDNHRVAAYLRQFGYRYHYAMTETHLRFENPDKRYEAQVFGISPFEDAYIELTPLSPPRAGAISQPEMKRRYVQAAYQNMLQLSKPEQGPRFVMAHFMLPHPPFVFAPDGSSTIPYDTRAEGEDWAHRGYGRDEYISGFRQQLAFTNKITLDIVDAILKNAKTQPIIIVQGDHGSKVTFLDHKLNPECAGETFSVLHALYAPDRVKAKFYRSISNVNTFRLILSEVFGQDLPFLPDRSYYSPYGMQGTAANIFKFTEITDLVAASLPQGEPLMPLPTRAEVIAAQERSARLIGQPAEPGAAPAAAAPTRGN